MNLRYSSRLLVLVCALLIMVSGCASSEVRSYQKIIDDIDYQTAGNVVRKNVSPPIGGVAEGISDYVAVYYEGPEPREELIVRLNGIGADCTTYEDSFYVSCRGIDNTVIKVTLETISIDGNEVTSTCISLSRR